MCVELDLFVLQKFSDAYTDLSDAVLFYKTFILIDFHFISASLGNRCLDYIFFLSLIPSRVMAEVWRLDFATGNKTKTSRAKNDILKSGNILHIVIFI